MARILTIAICTLVLLVANVATALACDTSGWLQLGGGALPGGTVPLRGGGLDAGGVLFVWDRSTGDVIGEGEVTPDGRLEAEIRIPADAGGAHKVIAVPAAGQARDSAHSPADPHAWTDVIVARPAGAPPVMSAVGDDPAASSQVEAGTLLTATIALMTLALIALIAVVARRRARRDRISEPSVERDNPHVASPGAGRDAAPHVRPLADDDPAAEKVLTSVR